MSDRAFPFVLGPAESGGGKASTSFKVRTDDTAGLLSVFEFTLAAWESGPVLHLHKASDESFYMLSSELELQIGDERSIVSPGGFAWVPRGTPHTFANTGEAATRGTTIATPGGIERMFQELAEYVASTNGRPDQHELDAIRHRHGEATLGPMPRSLN
jgi:uncharacterized cupin superfamily protein